MEFTCSAFIIPSISIYVHIASGRASFVVAQLNFLFNPITTSPLDSSASE